MSKAPQDAFQDELEWCISQLEANLHFSPTPKQAEETQHILNVLRSHEAPSGKKRQVMNHVFGDYRLKMAEDQKSTEKAAVKVQQSNGQAPDGVVYGKQSDQIFETKPKRFLSSDNSFCFDFTLSEAEPGAMGTSLEAVPGVSSAEQIKTNSTEQEKCNGALSFAASGQEPKIAFNFAIPNKDCPLVLSANQQTERTADREALGDPLPTEPVALPQVSDLQKPELTPAAGSAPKEDGSHVTLTVPQPESAPGDVTVTEKSTAGGAGQKKKKKKQKTSVSKKETEETDINRTAKAEANGCQNEDNCHQDETFQQPDEQLWKEVDWCVEQLELGLKTQKSTPKQAEEARRAIKTLRSDKAPLVKKRQLMRTMFGDYRKKMEEEWRKELKLMEIAVKSAKVVEVKGNIRNRNGQFIRKSSAASRKSQSSAGSPSESPRTLLQNHPDSFKFTTPHEEFCFNFF